MKFRVLSMNLPTWNGGDAVTASIILVGSLRSHVAYMNPRRSLAEASTSFHIRSNLGVVKAILDFRSGTWLTNRLNPLNA